MVICKLPVQRLPDLQRFVRYYCSFVETLSAVLRFPPLLFSEAVVSHLFGHDINSQLTIETGSCSSCGHLSSQHVEAFKTSIWFL